MRKLVVGIVLILLVIAVAFLLFDGGYIARWTGNSTVASRPKDDAPAATVPAAGDTTQPAQPAEPAPNHSKVQDDFLSRLGGLNIGLIAFSIAIVMGALIKLLSKLIPSVIKHE